MKKTKYLVQRGFERRGRKYRVDEIVELPDDEEIVRLRKAYWILPYAPKSPKPEVKAGLYVVRAPGLVTHGGAITIPPGVVILLGGHAAEKYGERVHRVELRELLALEPETAPAKRRSELA